MLLGFCSHIQKGFDCSFAVAEDHLANHRCSFPLKWGFVVIPTKEHTISDRVKNTSAKGKKEMRLNRGHGHD